MRLYNGASQAVSFTVNNFSVAAEGSTGLNPAVETSLGLERRKLGESFRWETVNLCMDELKSDGGRFDYCRFGRGDSVSEFTIITGDGRPKLYNAEVKVSSDKNN